MESSNSHSDGTRKFVYSPSDGARKCALSPTGTPRVP